MEKQKMKMSKPEIFGLVMIALCALALVVTACVTSFKASEVEFNSETKFEREVK